MTNWILIDLAAVLIAFVLVELRWPLQRPRLSRPTPQSPVDEAPMDNTVWPTGYPHDAPDQPFTITGALMAMRLHDKCPDTCPRKSAATQALRDAHVSPSLGVR